MIYNGKTSKTVKFYCKDKLINDNQYKINYYEAYPVLEHQKPDNAIKWATLPQKYKLKDTYTYLTDKDGKRIIDKPPTKPKVIEVENKFTNIELVRIETRSQGGRAWKIRIPVGKEFVYMDMREDEVLDTIKNGRIEKGKLLDEFILISYGDMKVVRVGSDKYNETMKHHTEEKNYVKPKKIPFKKMKVGYKYMTEGKNTAYYLGKFKFKDDRETNNLKSKVYVGHFFIDAYRSCFGEEKLQFLSSSFGYKKSSSYIKECEFNKDITMENVLEYLKESCKNSIKCYEEMKLKHYDKQYVLGRLNHYESELVFLNSIEHDE